MKRIYMALALVSGLAFGAKAQTVDIEAAAFAYDGANFKLGAVTSLDTNYKAGTADSVYGALALFLNTGDLISGDKFSILSSFNHYVQPGDPNYDPNVQYFYISTYTLNAAVTAGDILVTDGVRERVDSIGLLLDWAKFQQDSIKLQGAPWAPFVNGQAYGFFVQSRGVEGGTDTDPNNDLDAVRIIWNGGGTGLSEMLAPKEKISLNVYPNPASNSIKFSQNFEDKSDVTIIVRDAVGRAAITKRMGKLYGNQNFDVDISSLNSGIYTVELSSSYVTGLSKFSKL
jgi:hypothetical protein